MADAREVRIVLTHDHGDHAGGVPKLVERLDCETWGPAGARYVERPLHAGEHVSTDQGELVAVPTPGHAERHLALHWPEAEALFVGDLLLGEGSTTWVGAYAGCVADYLGSLARVDGLEAKALYPAHGPPLTRPTEAVARFRAHRLKRVAQMRELLARRPNASEAELVEGMYGDAPPEAERAILASVGALREHVLRSG